MRIAYTRAGESLDDLAARVHTFEGKATATTRRSAGRALRDANPFLRRLSDVPEGTLVIVPELERAAPADETDYLEAAAAELVVGRLREAAAQAVELLGGELDYEVADARRSLEVLRSSDARRLVRADDEARHLREATEDAVKERVAAAERLGDYRKEVVARVEQDLDELLAALRGPSGRKGVAKR